MSKTLKIVVGVVAAIAIPFAAPVVAKALGAAKLFGALGLGAKAASIAGTAAAGGLLGGVSAAAQGQNIAKGALMGGVSSGAAALLSGAGAAKGAVAGAKGAAAPAAGGISPIAATGTAGAPMSAIPAGALSGGAGGASGIASAVGTGAVAAKTGIASALTKPGVILAGGALVGSALAGSGASAATRNAQEQGQAELDRLRGQDQMVFDAKFKGANELLGMADYANPEYAGLQSARRAQLQGAAARGDALRGKTGYRRQAESRRLDLDTARNVGTAFDSGFTSGFEQNVTARTAGLNALPGQQISRTSEQTALLGYDEARMRERDRNRAGIGSLWANLMNPSASVG